MDEQPDSGQDDYVYSDEDGGVVVPERPAIMMPSDLWSNTEGRWSNTSAPPNFPFSHIYKGNLMGEFRHTSVVETDFDTQEMLVYFRQHPVERLVRFEKTYNLKDGPARALDFFIDRLDAGCAVFQVYERNRRIQGFWEGAPVHIEISSKDQNEDITSTNVEMFGDRAVLGVIRDALEALFLAEHNVPVNWWYKADGRTNSRKVFLPALKTTIVTELYPDISPDPKTYMERYLASDASVLLMTGPPGTGKTTLLRHMIKEHELGAHVIYDETLMSSDSIFQNFLFESSGDMMIIEDADQILSAREQDQNKMMARFLNVSDGLIKLPNKKLVFTTNISDFNKVDPAIIRPGRCFGVLHTRALDLTEAQAAARARVCGLPIPTRKQQYTLAELFNQGTQQVERRSIGFVS